MNSKVVLGSSIVLFIVLVGTPAQGLEPLVLYDEFNTKLIDPNKWTGFEFQTGTTREAVREIQRGRLRLAYAIYGDPSFDGGRRDGGTRVHFANPPAVTAMEATVQITKFQVTDCPNSLDLSHVNVNLQGFFFNTGVPIPGDHTNDVTARIMIGRDSGSQDPPQVLRITAAVHIHNGPSLFDHDLGTVRRGQRVRLRIQWDADNNRFIFKRDNQPEVIGVYTVSDTSPPGHDSKFFDITNLATNCTSQPLPVAFMEAFFDNVFVNESAAP